MAAVDDLELRGSIRRVDTQKLQDTTELRRRIPREVVEDHDVQPIAREHLEPSVKLRTELHRVPIDAAEGV